MPAGARVRLRIVNAGSDTAYRFAVGGHRLTVTHADGLAVQPADLDTVLVGMGERYDVVLTARSGAWPAVAAAEGKGAAAVAVLRSTDAATTRELPVHHSTLDALGNYTRLRDRLCASPCQPSFFLSTRGKRLLYSDIRRTLLDVAGRAGLEMSSPSCRFATRSRRQACSGGTRKAST